jgi:hypothetical protein
MADERTGKVTLSVITLASSLRTTVRWADANLDPTTEKILRPQMIQLNLSMTWPKQPQRLTHSSVIKTTFLVYFAEPAGIMATCDEMGVGSIIGRWNLFA